MELGYVVLEALLILFRLPLLHTCSSFLVQHISASSIESWACFSCLSLTAFWGYLFGRVALMDGVRKKRGGYSSILLSNAVVLLFLFWALVFLVSSWDTPASVMIVRHGTHSGQPWTRQKAMRMLQ